MVDSFSEYQKNAVERFQTLLSSHPAGFFDENGLPAYTNPNPWMRRLFWQRVRIAMRFLTGKGPFDTCLDFGCGLGVMIPFLTTISRRVVALDLDTARVEQIGREEGWERVTYCQSLVDLQALLGKIDAIVAMDVLEHVDDLEGTLAGFEALLAPGGVILVSGPTENGLYKIGRALARYSGHYHVRNIYDIQRALSRRFALRPVATLYPLAPLFLISCAVARPAGLSE